MPIIEFIGWLAAAYTGTTALPVADAINDYNTKFAMAVDAGDSCFDRIGGEVGSYGVPGDFDLDPLCNYRLETYEMEDTVTKWRLIRSD
jgi:hypothetical protein